MRTKLPTSSDETIALLKDYGAVEEGHFLLASGKHSNFYVKKGKLVQHPWELQQMIEQRVDAMRELGQIDVVLSPAMGGVPVGQQVGLALHARTIYAERNAETNQLELKRGFEIHPGERLLLVEDVITTGVTRRSAWTPPRRSMTSGSPMTFLRNVSRTNRRIDSAEGRDWTMSMGGRSRGSGIVISGAASTRGRD